MLPRRLVNEMKLLALCDGSSQYLSLMVSFTFGCW